MISLYYLKHAGHCWRSKDELISDVLLWTPTYGRAKAGRPAWTYMQQLCKDTGCNPEDLPEAMNDREKWRERVRDICAGGTTWWWWWGWWLKAAQTIRNINQAFVKGTINKLTTQYWFKRGWSTYFGDWWQPIEGQYRSWPSQNNSKEVNCNAWNANSRYLCRPLGVSVHRWPGGAFVA